MKRPLITILLLIPLVISCRHKPAPLQVRQIAIPPLSEECPEAAVEKFGRPMMLEIRKGLFLGLSVATDHGPEHYPYPAYFWTQNRSDEDQWLSSCADMDWFRMYGFTVYDSQGHRVRSRWENEQSATGCSQAITCESTATGRVMPHTCRPPEPSASYDLAYVYRLSPGQYTLRVVDMSQCKANPDTGILQMPDRLTAKDQAAPFLTIRIDPR